jgi:hypothetical protein
VELCKQYLSTVEFNFVDSTALINLGDPSKRALRCVAWNVLRRILEGHIQPSIIRHSPLPSRPLVTLPYNWWREASRSPKENHQSTSVAAATPEFNDCGLHVITSRDESHLAESGIAFDSKSAVLGQQATVYSLQHERTPQHITTAADSPHCQLFS